MKRLITFIISVLAFVSNGATVTGTIQDVTGRAYNPRPAPKVIFTPIDTPFWVGSTTLVSSPITIYLTNGSFSKEIAGGAYRVNAGPTDPNVMAIVPPDTNTYSLGQCMQIASYLAWETVTGSISNWVSRMNFGTNPVLYMSVTNGGSGTVTLMNADTGEGVGSVTRAGALYMQSVSTPFLSLTGDATVTGRPTFADGINVVESGETNINLAADGTVSAKKLSLGTYGIAKPAVVQGADGSTSLVVSNVQVIGVGTNTITPQMFISSWDSNPSATNWSDSAIRSALSRLPSGGGTVRFPSGSYSVSNTIYLQPGQRLVGADGPDDGGTVLKWYGGDGVVVQMTNYSAIAGFTIQNMTTSSNNCAIGVGSNAWVQTTWQTEFDLKNLKIYNFGIGISLGYVNGVGMAHTLAAFNKIGMNIERANTIWGKDNTTMGWNEIGILLNAADGCTLAPSIEHNSVGILATNGCKSIVLLNGFFDQGAAANKYIDIHLDGTLGFQIQGCTFSGVDYDGSAYPGTNILVENSLAFSTRGCWFGRYYSPQSTLVLATTTTNCMIGPDVERDSHYANCRDYGQHNIIWSRTGSSLGYVTNAIFGDGANLRFGLAGESSFGRIKPFYDMDNGVRHFYLTANANYTNGTSGVLDDATIGTSAIWMTLGGWGFGAARLSMGNGAVGAMPSEGFWMDYQNAVGFSGPSVTVSNDLYAAHFRGDGSYLTNLQFVSGVSNWFFQLRGDDGQGEVAFKDFNTIRAWSGNGSNYWTHRNMPDTADDAFSLASNFIRTNSTTGIIPNTAIGTAEFVQYISGPGYGHSAAMDWGLGGFGQIPTPKLSLRLDGLYSSNTISAPMIKSTSTNAVVLKCPNGGSFILTVGNNGALNVITNSTGL